MNQPSGRDAARVAPDYPEVQLLWTGGWDSSYRLLTLLLVHRRAVQPHYLVDPERESTIFEMHTMDRMAETLAEQFAETRSLLRPLRKVERESLVIDSSLKRSFEEILSGGRLGTQYLWLACLAKQEGIPRLELAIHREDRRIAYWRTTWSGRRRMG